MNTFFTTQSTKLFIAGGALLLVLLVVISVVIARNVAVQAPSPVVSTPVPFTPYIKREIQPRSISAIPTLPPAQGGTVDTTSTIIQTSKSELNRVYPLLPYSKDLLTNSGITTSVVIPPQELQDNSWTLLIQIFGVDYRVPVESPDYQTQRSAFVQSAQDTLQWLRTNGVDTSKIIIVWGDKEFIENRAQEWLK